MGGAKPAGDGDGKKPKGGLFGSLKPSAKPQNDAISNAAAVTADLESQYSKVSPTKMQRCQHKRLHFTNCPIL